MRIGAIAAVFGIVLVLGCDRSTPLTPDMATEITPDFNWTNPFPEGRMTGGGVVRVLANNGEQVKVTNGLTLHCDIALSNNLEINWGGNRWHIEKESLIDVRCTDAPGVNPEPPPAPFDTFEAWAFGSYNGVPGSYVHFKFQDAGQPGGNNDKAMIRIWEPGTTPWTDDPILYVPWEVTQHGNLQAHYDQPHGSNVNK